MSVPNKFCFKSSLAASMKYFADIFPIAFLKTTLAAFAAGAA